MEGKLVFWLPFVIWVQELKIVALTYCNWEPAESSFEQPTHPVSRSCGRKERKPAEKARSQAGMPPCGPHTCVSGKLAFHYGAKVKQMLSGGSCDPRYFHFILCYSQISEISENTAWTNHWPYGTSGKQRAQPFCMWKCEAYRTPQTQKSGRNLNRMGSEDKHKICIIFG